MKATNKIQTLADSLKKHLFATGENNLHGLSGEFYAQAMGIVEDLAALEGEGVGYAIAKKIARKNGNWHANLSDKQAYCLAREIFASIESGKIDAENFGMILPKEEGAKVAKTAEKTAKKATNWKKAKDEKAAAEAAELEEVAAICTPGSIITHSSLGRGEVVSVEGENAVIRFGKVEKKLMIRFLVGKITLAA